MVYLKSKNQKKKKKKEEKKEEEQIKTSKPRHSLIKNENRTQERKKMNLYPFKLNVTTS